MLWFLHENAPDPVTRQVARLAAAVERRHDALADTAGLSEEVFDALVVLAAGSWGLQAIASGYERVVKLQSDMDHTRRQRLLKLGFAEQEAGTISALHTRNFMQLTSRDLGGEVNALDASHPSTTTKNSISKAFSTPPSASTRGPDPSTPQPAAPRGRR